MHRPPLSLNLEKKHHPHIKTLRAKGLTDIENRNRGGAERHLWKESTMPWLDETLPERWKPLLIDSERVERALTNNAFTHTHTHMYKNTLPYMHTCFWWWTVGSLPRCFSDFCASRFYTHARGDIHPISCLIVVVSTICVTFPDMQYQPNLVLGVDQITQSFQMPCFLTH